jgi:predicted XRE-type DNA-binding protein
MAVRRRLLALILQIARRDGLEDGALAHCCGMTRPRASNLLHGRIEKFNSETLVDALAQLGVSVELTVTRRAPYARFKVTRPRPGWHWPDQFAPRYLTPDWRTSEDGDQVGADRENSGEGS